MIPQAAALRWASTQAAAGKCARCLDAVARAAAAGVLDKAMETREAGTALMLALLEARFCMFLKSCVLCFLKLFISLRYEICMLYI